MLTDSLNVKLEGSSATDLGLSGSSGANVFTSGRIVLVALNTVAVDAIKINGQNLLLCTSVTTAATNAAKVIADAINLNTSVHGAVATAFNRVVGAEMGDDFSMTATFSYYY